METQPTAYPRFPSARSAASNGSRTASRPEPPATCADGLRVLVVDPDDDIRLTLVFTLWAEGWEVLEADCMAAANWAVREHHPTVVLTELVLSGQESTGLVFINALRGYDPGLPVVVLTALTVTTERRQRTMTAGARHVIGKPFVRDSLLALLEGCHRADTAAAGAATRDASQLSASNGAGPDWAAVGRVIGERRRAIGMPKNEAARQARVSNTTWRLLEAGRSRNPSHETVVRVAKVIDIDPEELLCAGSQAQPPPNGLPLAAAAPQAMDATDPQTAIADPTGADQGSGATE